MRERTDRTNVARRWDFFDRGPSDLRRLLDNEANKSRANYFQQDAAIVDHMVRETLRQARWHYRMRVWYWVAVWAKAHARRHWERSVAVRQRRLWNWAMTVARWEELAAAHRNKKRVSPSTSDDKE